MTKPHTAVRRADRGRSPAVLAQAEPVRLSDGNSFWLGDSAIGCTASTRRNCIRNARTRRGSNWPCGIRARSELRRLIGTHPVECKAVTVDRFGRIVATCHAGGRILPRRWCAPALRPIFTRPGVASPYEKAQAKRAPKSAESGPAASTSRASGDAPIRATRRPAAGLECARMGLAGSSPRRWQWLRQKFGR